MAPILTMASPILVDLDALPRQSAPIAAMAINLMRGKTAPKDAIIVDIPDPLAALIALARRKNRP